MSFREREPLLRNGRINNLVTMAESGEPSIDNLLKSNYQEPFLSKIKNFFNSFDKQSIAICGILATLVFISVAILATVGDSQDDRPPQEIPHKIPSLGHSLLQSTANGNINFISLIERDVLTTPLGKLQGVKFTSRDGKPYFGFMKVPYAKPPTGRRRFKSPEPADQWNGILNATVEAPECIQKAKYSPIDEAKGEESCLFVNIYTTNVPVQSDTQLLPTMVYFHGGGLTDGNGSRYGAKYFMDEPVVLLTVHYRLGAFGFLNTQDWGSIGNMGFKDQVLSLKWTRKNIKAFGGDPDRITIFGNSAGGLSSSYHMLSPMSRNYFDRAITQSGPAIGAGGIDLNPRKTTEILATQLNCSIRSTRRLMRCLRDKEAHEIASFKTSEMKYQLTLDYIDDEDDMSDIFMTDAPLNLMRNGQVNKVPWIVGINSAESLKTSLINLLDVEFIDDLNANWTQLAPQTFSFSSTGVDPNQMANEIRDFFFEGQDVSNETERNLTALLSDRFMVHATYISMRYQSKYSPVYPYYLSKESPKSYAWKELESFPKGEYGSAHADELQLMFLYYGYPEISPNDTQYYTFSKLLVKTWAHFAASGVPYSLPNGAHWEAIQDPNSFGLYELCDEPKISYALNERMKFWDKYSAKDLLYE